MRVKERYAGDAIVQPVLHRAVFQFTEEWFLLEVPLYSKTK